MSKKVLF